MSPTPSHLVDELLAQYLDTAGWQQLCNKGAVEVSCKGASKSRALVRVSISVNVSVEHTVAFLRPESLFGAASSFFQEGVQQVEIVRSFGAGDVLGRLRFAKSGLTVAWAMLRDRSVKKGEDELEGCYRVVLRRNVPVAGAFAILAAPLDTQRYELCEKLGPQLARTIVVEPEADGARTRLSITEKVLRNKLWLLPLMPNWTDLARLEAKIAAHHQQATDNWGFVVLRIRKCCRGPPLVPATWPPAPGTEVDWTPFVEADGGEEQEFRLASYLQQLLPAIGIRHAEVFDHLDGGRLVFYQAALRRPTWQEVRPAVETALQAHRPAYRLAYGGSGAPYLHVDVAPRFARLAGSAAFTAGVPYDSQEEEDFVAEDDESLHWKPLPVKNTFIEFSCTHSAISENDACSAP